MTPEDLKRGVAYYRLTFADVDLTIPGVQPLIYIGTNVFPDDDQTSAVCYLEPRCQGRVEPGERT